MVADVEAKPPAACAGTDITAQDMPLHEKKKVHRKRMRKLYAEIREQMEFYFSDANLRRDRFLKKEIDQSEDGYVALSLFQNFNKMKAICTDTAVIAKALSKCSTALQVSEEMSKVRRCSPVENGTPESVDIRTVYVESLPRNVTHDWVKQVFSDFGKVAYVSLPRYKTTGDPKGFAFVEFEAEEAAIRCCESLGTNDFQGAQCFPKGNRQILKLQKRAAVEIPDGAMETVSSTVVAPSDANSTELEVDVPLGNDSAEQQGMKRKHGGATDMESPSKKVKKDKVSKKKKRGDQSIAADDGLSCEGIQTQLSNDKDGLAAVSAAAAVPPGGKRASSCGSQQAVKGRIGVACNAKDTSPSAIDRPAKKNCVEKIALVAEVANVTAPEERDEVDESNSEDPAGTASSRTRKHRKKKSAKEKTGKSCDKTEADVLRLKVIPKSRWLALRKEYLAIQKANMSALKKALKLHLPPVESAGSAASSRPCSTWQIPGQPVAARPTEGAGIAQRGAPPVEFVPGVIVRVACQGGSDAMTRQIVKAKLPSNVDVAYVDIAEGQSEGHIRCKTNEAASLLCVAAIEGFSFSLLQGSNETAYWDKLRTDREQRLRSKQRGGSTKKQRGSQKIVERSQKAASDSSAAAATSAPTKHIRFES